MYASRCDGSGDPGCRSRCGLWALLAPTRWEIS
jgi:hypothetical protein